MTLTSRKSVLSYCQCGQIHQVKRRWFLRSLLPGAIAFPLLPKTQPTKSIEHKAKVLVLSCIDFRFLEPEILFLSERHLEGQYDWIALAGASLAMSGFPHASETEVFWDQLSLSYELHHIETVIIFDHQDCGAYASKIDRKLLQNPYQEQKVHTDYLSRAYWAIRNRYPTLDIELYFVTLDARVKTIVPTHTSLHPA